MVLSTWGPNKTGCDLCSHSACFVSARLAQSLLFEPYPLFACRLSGQCRPLGTLFAAAFSASLAWKSRRRHFDVETCRAGQRTPFQAARVAWSHRRRAFVISFLQRHHFLLKQKVSRHHAEEALGADSCASGQLSFSL